MLKPKINFLILLTAMVSLSTFSTDIYLPSLPEMTTYFQTTPATIQLTLSFYMLGFALSVLLSGTIADCYGRRVVVLGGMSLHLIATICCILAPRIEIFLIARFFQALGGCSGTVLGRVIVRDLFNEKECIKILSYLSAGLTVALTAAPILGGYLQAYFDWRAHFFVLAIASSAIWIGAFYWLPESLDLQKRQPLHPMKFVRNYFVILQNRHFLGYTLTITCAWAGYFSFISGSSFVFINLLKVTPQAYGVLYALTVIGYILGTLLASRWRHRWNAQQSVLIGAIFVLVGGISMLLLAFIFRLNVFSLIVPMLFYLFGTGLIMPNSQAVVTQPFPGMVGSASSLFYFIEMLFGALAGTLVGIFQNNSQIPMVIVIASSSVALFIIFYRLIHRKIPA